MGLFNRQERYQRNIQTMSNEKLVKYHQRAQRMRGRGPNGFTYERLYQMAHAEMERRGLNPPKDPRFLG